MSIDLVPLSLWVSIMAEDLILKNFWALTATDKNMHGLRVTPDLIAWRRLQVKKELKRLMQLVSEANEALFIITNSDYIFSEIMSRFPGCGGCSCWCGKGCCGCGDEIDYQFLPSFELCEVSIPYALSQLHLALSTRATVIDIMGGAKTAKQLVSSADKKVVKGQELKKMGGDNAWEDYPLAFLASTEAEAKEEVKLGSWYRRAWVTGSFVKTAADKIESIVRIISQNPSELLDVARVPIMKKIPPPSWKSKRHEMGPGYESDPYDEEADEEADEVQAEPTPPPALLPASPTYQDKDLCTLRSWLTKHKTQIGELLVTTLTD